MPAISAHDLRLAHDHRVALEVDTLDLPAGKVVALIGPNGSGKTTLIQALTGLLRPLRGHLTVLGSSPGTRRRDVAIVLQHAATDATLPIMVREVVTMGRWVELGLLRSTRAVDRAAVDLALERLEITDLANRQLGALSAGERQRVLVAQGLAQQAALLLLDEPVTDLDLPSHRRILEVMAEERDAGRTVLFATHDLADAREADHVVLLAGCVVADGSADTVLTATNLAAAYGERFVRVEGGFLVDDAPHHDHGAPDG